MKMLCTAALLIALPAMAAAQQIPVFADRAEMRGTLNALMRDRAFVATVERFAPEGLVSTGRIQILEDRFANQIDPLTQSGAIFSEKTAQDVRREVIGYWAGETYVYVGLLSHKRPNDLVVLDFRITGDVREATRWFLTGATR